MKGITVALIGADGAGKTTVGRALQRVLPVPVKYIYMGMNYEAMNELLPTTRLVRALRRRRGLTRSRTYGSVPSKPSPKGFPARLLREARSFLGLMNRLAEEWFRQWVAWRYTRRGAVVVFDRHFYSDYYAHDIDTASRERSWSRAVHALMLKHLYPKPDLLILLDAPPTVLWNRKREGTFEAVERRREEYFRLRNLNGSLPIVDATQPRDAVLLQVAQLILERYEIHGRASGPSIAPA